jgi:hypothetical protein
MRTTKSILILSVVTFLIFGFTLSDETPKGWAFGADRTNYKVSLDNKISQHGQKSASIESIVENPLDFCSLMQTVYVQEFIGKRIKMTGYIRSQGLNDTTTMWIRVDDYGNKTMADFDNMWDRPIVGTKDWTKCEIIFDVPEKSVINFGFILRGAGKIWVDNVSFEIVSNSTDKTAQFTGQAFSDERQEYLKQFSENSPEKHPVNLDFEE